MPFGTSHQEKIYSTPPSSAAPPASDKKEGAPEDGMYCPTSIDELTILFKNLGMNGKSKTLAQNFFDEYSALGWQVNTAGGLMRDVPAYVRRYVNKFRQEAKEKDKYPAYKAIIDMFFVAYKTIHENDFVGFDDRQGKAVKEIIDKIKEAVRKKNQEKNQTDQSITSEIIVQSFAELLKWIIEDKKADFYRQNLSPRFISQNFNRILSTARGWLTDKTKDDSVTQRMKNHQTEFEKVWNF